jgi:hypothetical protein
LLDGNLDVDSLPFREVQTVGQFRFVAHVGNLQDVSSRLKVPQGKNTVGIGSCAAKLAEHIDAH